MLFRTISTAFLAGVLAGLCLFALQRILTVPLIHAAEVYEKDASNVESSSDIFAKDPLRSMATLLGDIIVAVGFAFILSGIYALSGLHGWPYGLLFGLAGFATFQLAPAVVVPPAVPGMYVASLALRQTGWWVAAGSTIAGLILIFSLMRWAKLAGIIVLLLPAAVFRLFLSLPAPTTPLHPLALLDQAFVTRTLGCMLVFWLILGAISGHLFARAGRNPMSMPAI
jgi:cobalt transporter subunit CbtA